MRMSTTYYSPIVLDPRLLVENARVTLLTNKLPRISLPSTLGSQANVAHSLCALPHILILTFAASTVDVLCLLLTSSSYEAPHQPNIGRVLAWWLSKRLRWDN